jgi:hypothetical protein
MEPNQIEEWKSLDFMKFSKYSISTFGNFRNNKTCKLLNPCINFGYYYINLHSDDKTRKYVRVHCLMAKAFLMDKKRDDQNTVDHINRNGLDNNILNLRWHNMHEQNLNKTKSQLTTNCIPIIQKDKNGMILNTFRTTGDAMKHLNISSTGFLYKILRNQLIKEKLDYTLEFEYKKDLENEVWKEVKLITSKKIYVSQFGRIKSGKKIFTGDKGVGGYKRIIINHKHYLVHRLIAEEFCSGKSKERNIVNHKDSNKINNNAINLDWCSIKENAIHSIKSRTIKKFYHKVAKCDDNMNIIEIFDSMRSAARKYNVVKTSINSSINRNHRCKGFYWKYV